MKEVAYNQYLKEVDQHLRRGGLFLNSGHDDINTMVIGWGGINIYWENQSLLFLLENLGTPTVF